MKKISLIIVLCVCCAFSAMSQLKVTSSGKVGVGQSTPQEKFDIAGNIRLMGNLYLGNDSSFLGTTGNNLIFKIGNDMAGRVGSNTAFGLKALNTWTGYGNTAMGYEALVSNTEGVRNTGIGNMVLYQNTTGHANTAVGYEALCFNTTGYNNTAIGYMADCKTGNQVNSTAIGYNAVSPASNQVMIGNSSVTKIGGYVAWTTYPSDGRTKKNIRQEVPGLAFIKLLQPVTYTLDLNAIDELLKLDDKKMSSHKDSLLMARSSEEKALDAKSRAHKEKQVYSGFIAQDVEKAAKSIGYNFSGIDVPEEGKGAYGIRYAEFVVPLVKAVQELSEQNARLQEEINQLKGNVLLRSAADEMGTTGTVDPVVSECVLYQNTPNPFSQDTQIKFYIPESVNTALLCIYNLQGTQIKQIQITGRGEGSQWISGSELAAGMYLYTLIVDGKGVDAKRMILTK